MGRIPSPKSQRRPLSHARVLFRARGGALIGGGHLMRCVSLANALTRKGFDVSFSVNAGALVALPLIETFPLYREEETDFLNAAANGNRPADVLIVDDYDWSAENDTRCRLCFPFIAAIDDLANRPRNVDLLIDPNLNRRKSDYRPLLPENVTILTGPQYAMLRSAFPEARPLALAARARPKRLERILVTLGLGDNSAPLASVLKTLAQIPQHIDVDIVTGNNEPPQETANDNRFHYHGFVSDMASMMVDADLCIGAGGSSSWERCCLALPSIQLILAENQIPVATELAQLGACVALDIKDQDLPARLNSALRDLTERPDALNDMSHAAAKVCDGEGAERTANIIANLTSSNIEMFNNE
jgi:UDP-2,4-diacetamido-2,4,6-trideoxy-beta-L-altropyranose hydrolase